jgi:beta-lactamase class A
MTRNLQRVLCSLFAALAIGLPAASPAAAPNGPLAQLQARLDSAVDHAPGRVGIAVEDLATGMTTGVNAGTSLPAASTIKIPVMVEVFRQMADGDIDLNTKLHLRESDRDDGWGDMAYARANTQRTVEQLLRLMIDDSDNTATNMLIRLVGRQKVNRTMAELGLRDTNLGDYIRSATDGIRYSLRSSPRDMVKLLDSIARRKLVDAWSSGEMLAILTGQTHNGLLPQPLPKKLQIAHKTGSLHDTLNDVGIVFRANEPYVIAVMTTQLPSLPMGRRFIHDVSKLTYDELGRFTHWREDEGLPGFALGMAAPGATTSRSLAPDLQMWNADDSTALPALPEAQKPWTAPEPVAPDASTPPG